MNNINQNILLIAGSGRNIGKTTLGCMLIKKYKNLDPVSIKVSPHYHDKIPDKGYNILLENRYDLEKDSSRYLRAGSKKSFYIESTDQYLLSVWREVEKEFSDTSPVIIESGGLISWIQPALFIYLLHPSHQPLDEYKKNSMNKADWVLNSNNSILNNVSDQLVFNNNVWKRL